MSLTEGVNSDRKFKRHKDNVVNAVGFLPSKERFVEATNKVLYEYNDKADRAKQYQASQLHHHHDQEH